MKCPECSYNQPVKQGMTCGSCGYVFIFHPKGPYRMTDGRFRAMIRNVSQDGTQYYTKNQLLLRFARVRFDQSPHAKPGCVVFAIAVLAFGLLALGVGGGIGIPLTLFGAIGTLIVLFSKFAYSPPSEQLLEDMLGEWRKAGRTLDMMIEEPSLHEPPPEWREPDIYDYGVERLLIVEHDLLVDLFVLNGWHAENRALVIAESGYPNYLLPHAKRLLEEREDLPVFVLHDASPSGAEMAGRVQRSTLLPLAGRAITDLGMNAEDVRKLKRLRPLGKRVQESDAPVDLLPFMMLGSGAAAAVGAGIPLGALLAREQAATSAAAASHSSFG